jgi:NAD(P)-dependent dehydrogenase (short-subunit alcohol dehydrogenase family)
MSLVNNAGITTIGDVEALTLDTWSKTLAVNLDMVFVGTQAAIAHEKPRQHRNFEH